MTARHAIGSRLSRVRIAALACLLLIVPGLIASEGCRQASVPDEPCDYGKLPGLSGTANQKLRDELARLVDQKQTPELLMRPEIDDGVNVAAGLRDLVTPGEGGADNLESIRDASDELFPNGPFRFDAIELNKALKFCRRYDLQRRQAREALKRPQCDFGFRFVEGFTAPTRFIEVARVCGRLEAFHAAGCLFADQDPAGAIESLGCQLRLAECLGAEKTIEARLEAARLRAEALGVLQAIVGHEKIRLADLGRLRDMVHEHLKTWPSDADAWIGDRALGMVAYEIIRDGALPFLLTPEEIVEFAKDGSLQDLAEVARKTADQDELTYLETMREVIGRCAAPYHDRADLGETIQAELERRRSSADYPVVAGRMLLKNLDAGLRLQAEDRAAVEAWALALDLATGQPSTHQVNPLTGKPYFVKREPDRLAVWYDEARSETSPPDVLVPIPGG